MKSIKLSILVALLPIMLVSCGINKSASYEKKLGNSFEGFLQDVLNDTVYYDLTGLKITNENLYPILDSIIKLTEECEYFDSRVPYFHAFLFSFEKNNEGTVVYSINSNLSVEASLNILFRKALNPDFNIDKGIFYYKNYLFAVPMFNGKVVSEFNFFEKADLSYRVKATGLPNEQPFLNNIKFIERESNFSLISDNSCNPPAIIGQ